MQAPPRAHPTDADTFFVRAPICGSANQSQGHTALFLRDHIRRLLFKSMRFTSTCGRSRRRTALRSGSNAALRGKLLRLRSHPETVVSDYCFPRDCSKPASTQKPRLGPELRKYYLVWGRMTQRSRKIFQNSLLPLHIDARANGMGYCMPTCGLSSLLMIELQHCWFGLARRAGLGVFPVIQSALRTRFEHAGPKPY